MRAWRPLAAALFAVMAWAAAGCTSAPADTPGSGRTGPSTGALSGSPVDPAVVIGMAELRLSCQAAATRSGDPFNIAEGILLTCPHGEDALTNVFAFEHERGMRISLNDAGLGPGDELLLGSTWYAIGPPESLDALVDLDVAAVDSATRPPDVILSTHEEDLTWCIRYTVGAASTSITDPKQFDHDVTALDDLYPGLGEFVTDTFDDSTRAQFAGSQDGDVDLLAELATHHAEVLEFCETTS